MKLDIDIEVEVGKFNLRTAFVFEGSALGIFGPSGSGKTTLFRAIAGLTRPTRGQIILDNTVLFSANDRIFVPPHKRNIGVVFQEGRLFPHWSVQRNLRAGEVSRRRIRNRPFGFYDVVDLLDMGSLMDRHVTDLSGGEQQRVAIGRTLLANPRLLLLDEPVSGLDRHTKQRILRFLDRIHRSLGIPTLLISHDRDEIDSFANRVLTLKAGRVVGNTPVARVNHRTLQVGRTDGEIAPSVTKQADLLPMARYLHNMKGRRI